MARESRRRTRIRTCALCAALQQVALSAERVGVRVRGHDADQQRQRHRRRRRRRRRQGERAEGVFRHIGGESRFAQLLAAALAAFSAHDHHSNPRLPSGRLVGRLDARAPRPARCAPLAVRLRLRPQLPQPAVHLHSGARRAFGSRARRGRLRLRAPARASAVESTRERRYDRRAGAAREHTRRLVAYDLARACAAHRLHHAAHRTGQSLCSILTLSLSFCQIQYTYAIRIYEYICTV